MGRYRAVVIFTATELALRDNAVMVVAGSEAEDELLNGLKGGHGSSQSDGGAGRDAHVQSVSLKQESRSKLPASVFSSAMEKHKHR